MITTEDLYDALYRIGSEDDTADQIPPGVLNQLLAFKIAETDSDGQPRCANKLTASTTLETSCGQYQ